MGLSQGNPLQMAAGAVANAARGTENSPAELMASGKNKMRPPIPDGMKQTPFDPAQADAQRKNLALAGLLQSINKAQFRR